MSCLSTAADSDASSINGSKSDRSELEMDEVLLEKETAPECLCRSSSIDMEELDRDYSANNVMCKICT